MPKTKISEFDVDPANNTDINSINIAEGCAPSGINNAIRQLMSDLKEFQTGAGGDPFNGAVNGTVGATTPAAGTFTSLTDSGNLTFTGTGNRITGDFSNNTVANRAMFQTSTTNSTSIVSTIPNGTSNNATFAVWNNSNPANSSYSAFQITSTLASIDNGISGSGTLLPFAINTGGSERLRIDTSGNVGIGINSPSYKLDVRATGNVLGGFKGTGTIGALYLADANTTLETLYIGTVGNNFRVVTGNEERMRIDSSGNVGIGTSSPAVKFHTAITTTGEVGRFSTSVNDFVFGTVRSSSVSTFFGGADASIGWAGTLSNHAYAIKTNDAERMRITSGGTILVGTSSTLFSSNPSVQIVNSGDQFQIRNSSAASGKLWRYACDSNNTIYVINQNTTGVYVADGGTSWLGLSDERHKDIIEPITNAVEKVSLLRAVIGKYKTDAEGIRRSFLIAQDVQAVLPEAVFSADPEKLGLSYTDTIPLLVAAIKELKAEVDSLKAQLNA